MPVYALGSLQPVVAENAWLAESATVIGNVRLGRNTSIWYNVVIRGDHDPIVIGDNSNIQDGSVLHNDEGIPLTIGKGVTIGHMAMVHGCSIGDGSLIGINAIILNRAVIGKNCIIGANALIPEGKQIADRSLVVGSPGRVIRELSDDEVAALRANAEHYVANAQRFRSELQRIDFSGGRQ